MSTQAEQATEAEQAPDVFLRLDVFDRLTRERGWTNDLARARALGVSHTTVGRLRPDPGCADSPKSPGGRFIGAALRALDVEFDVLFERRAS